MNSIVYLVGLVVVVLFVPFGLAVNVTSVRSTPSFIWSKING